MDRFELSVDEILEATKGKFICGPLCSFYGVSTDTRTMGTRQLYVPIKGKNFDGHKFIEEAKLAGALGALVSEDVPNEDDEFVLIKVKDTRKALLDMAAYWRRQHPQLKVIAVTGTNGKTTTKEMLRWLLCAVGPTLASVKSYNNDIGVPLTLLDIRGYHKYLIVEIGASAPGEILPLAMAVKPDVAVITNVGSAHLETFKNRRNILETKAEIIKAVNPDGFVVLNADDPSFLSLKDMSKVPVISYSVEADDSDVHPSDVIPQTSATHFEIFDTQTRLPMGGIHNLYNALASLAVLKGLDLDYMRSARRIKGFTPPPMRGNIFYVGPVVIINDSFNCNPSSFEASLKYFEEVQSPSKTFILGDMLELGKESEKLHAEAGKMLAASSVSTFIGVGEKVKAAIDAFKEACEDDSKEVFHFEAGSHEEIAELLVPRVESGGAIMFKGSRNMKLEKGVLELINGLKRLYRKERI